MKKISAVIVSAVMMTGIFSFCPINYDNLSPTAVTAHAIDVPDGFGYTVVSEGKIRLTWDKVKDADGYSVYRMNKNTGKWEKLKSVTTCYLTVNNIKPNTKYYYKVAALVKKSDGKYYRGEFSNFLEVNVSAAKNKSPDLAAQNDYLASYYRNNLSASAKKDDTVKSKAFIAPADVYGTEVMLVNYTYEDGNEQTFMYGITGGKITAPLLIADSNDINNAEAYFVRDERNNEYYIFSSNNYSNSYEFRIGRVQNGQLYNITSANTVGNKLCFINGEIVNYGDYINLQSRYVPFNEDEYTVDESGEVYYLKKIK